MIDNDRILHLFYINNNIITLFNLYYLTRLYLLLLSVTYVIAIDKKNLTF